MFHWWRLNFARHVFESPLSNPDVLPAFVLTLAASLLLVARNMWRVGFGAEKRISIEAFYAVLCLGASAFIAIDLMYASRSFRSGNFEVFSILTILILFTSITICALRGCTLHGPAKKLRRSIHSWILVLLAMSMSGWTYHRVHSLISCLEVLGMGGVLPGVVEREDRSWAITDEGASIPLYHLATNDIQFQEYALSADERYKSFLHVMIHREDADKTTNCHGWVFSGGQFLLKGADVERILCDNRYFIVSDPKPNDIVIYRDQARNILHTALVQAILADGTVIAESKWGVDQRFLHLPADQPYSPVFEYYRTNRLNHHLINILASVDHGDLLDDG